MRVLKTSLCAIALTSLIVLGVGPTAHAADLGTVSWNGTTFSPSSLSGSANDTFLISSSNAVEIRGPVSLLPGGGGSISCTLAFQCTIASGASANFRIQNTGDVTIWEAVLYKATLTISSGGGSSGSGSSSSTSTAPPPTYSITFTSNATCSASSMSASSGSWVQLPKASQCTPPAAHAGATLLGWSTISNFPVTIAQRQVDRGWGAYQVFDANGALSGVFIPAGGYALLSSSTPLLPVWSR